MFRHVIVGVDGRPTGRDAIALARLLVAPGERLVLAHVRELTPLLAASGALEDLDDSTRLLQQERDATAADAELVSVAAPSVGRGLHQLAEERDADLLAIGSCSRGFVGRAIVGNDTREALNGASCAVAIAPHGYADVTAAIATIGVGYDGSPESEAALSLARDLAAQHGAAIRALEVVQLPTPAYVGMVPWGDALESMLTGAQERMAALDGVQGDAVLGLAAEELAAFGALVDLLVVGSRGYGPLRRLMLGSSSAHLASHARCPLVVLPRGTTPAPDPQVSIDGRDTVARQSS
jgi:nucleotide-binding universal stress UspA family protein